MEFVIGVALVAAACGGGSLEVSLPGPDQESPAQAPEVSARSVVRVSGEACGRLSVGGGVAIASDRVVTNAHVVAGIDDVSVTPSDGSESVAGIVVGFDTNRDLAIVELAAPVLAPVGVDAGIEEGAVHLVIVPEEAPAEVRLVDIRRPIVATGEDIYRRQGARRRVLELDGPVVAGESGSGLFGTDGALVGVVFANSQGDEPRSYAVAGSEIEAFLAEVDAAPQPAGPCLTQPRPDIDEPAD